MNIYVSNLSFNVQDEDLREFFAPYGEVTSAKIINDRESGTSRGFGFVEMTDEAAAKKAIAELDGGTVEGRVIKVVEARPKGDKPAYAKSPFRDNGGDKFNNANSYNKNRY
jgi:RNA recognition motif-containing protein